MKARTLGMRPKTLRSGIRSTPATLHLEITMLLHQERRLHSELSMLKERESLLTNLLEKNQQRIAELRNMSDAMDPEGHAISRTNRDQVGNARFKDGAEPACFTGNSSAEEKGDPATANNDNFRQLSLEY